MRATDKYELIRPILREEKSVKQVHQETGVPLSTLYRYLKRFREGDGKIESLFDKSHGAHSHPLWFTEEQINLVVKYKIAHLERSARQIAKDLKEADILEISYHSVSNILNKRRLSSSFFDQSELSKQIGKQDDSFIEKELEFQKTEVIEEKAEPISIDTERVDDIPLLLNIQQQMGIQQVIDSVITPHGNRDGLSFGWLTTTWLSYILSESDHRMCEVEEWSAENLRTLSKLLQQPVCQKDFTDDRLADVLRELSDDLTWREIEKSLGQRSIRVYNLHEEPTTVRLDSTTVYVYHDTENTAIFRLGHSKDHRPDLPQFKVMLATLDPLGLPLATLVVPGNKTDSELYLPAINSAKEIVGCGGRLYVGDSKMSTKENRGTIERQGDYYLAPLTMTGKVPQLKQNLLKEFIAGKHEFKTIKNTKILSQEAVSEKILAIAFETKRNQSVTICGEQVVWKERVLAVFSPAVAKTTRRAFSDRLEKAEKELLSLTPRRGHGKRQQDDIKALKAEAEEIIERYQVEEYLSLEYEREVERRYIRAYGERPPRYEENLRYVIHVKRNKEAIKKERLSLGWRFYATNAPIERLSLVKAVEVYRANPSIERDYGRLKGKSLGIRPLYVQREDHVIGMTRLLSLALRVLTTLEYVVRKRLENTQKPIAGLYSGNPKRKTMRPTAERLLKAFNGITLTVLEYPDNNERHITPLTSLQERILRLLGFPEEIYIGLNAPNSP